MLFVNGTPLNDKAEHNLFLQVRHTHVVYVWHNKIIPRFYHWGGEEFL